METGLRNDRYGVDCRNGRYFPEGGQSRHPGPNWAVTAPNQFKTSASLV